MMVLAATAAHRPPTLSQWLCVLPPPLAQVFSQVGDKWELLHYDRAVAINPQVEELLQEGAGGTAAACGQVRRTHTQTAAHAVVWQSR